MPDHDHPISTPCEPIGSGELKMSKFEEKLKPLQGFGWVIRFILYS